MHRDFMTTGPMAGLGFSRADMRRYNFTDEELRDNFSPFIASQIAMRRDQLICEKLVWRTTKRFCIGTVLTVLALGWWMVATEGEFTNLPFSSAASYSR